VPREQLEEIDMLPKIRNKCFLTPELAPTFASKDDDLIQILGIMTRILDGHGYESDTGAHGHRGYNEKMMFTWIGAAIDIPYKVHKLLATLGPKLYFLRVPKVEEKSEDDYHEQIKNDDFAKKIGDVENALFDYLDWFDICPSLVVEQDKEQGNHLLKKIQWDSENNEEKAVRNIIKLGLLLAPLRGVVPTWHTQDTQGSEYAYALPIIEEPDRAIQQLANLAKGHALSRGRNYITMEDVPLIVKVVLSTASKERVTIFDLLLANVGKLTTSQITEFLNTSPPTARRTMIELKALGLVDMMEEIIEETAAEKNGQRYYTMQIVLKEDVKWFLREEFKNLREEFKPDEYKDEEEKNDDVVVKSSATKGENFFPEVSTSADTTGMGIVVEEHEKEKTPLSNTENIRGNLQVLSY
jgi:DNA-binding transcriptional ArsR family regulator